MNVLVLVACFAAGFAAWSLMEYVLHRFAMHELRGKGIMSREHLEHHARSNFSLEWTNVASWVGIGVVGGAVFAPLGWLVASGWGAIVVPLGWALGYAFYEWHHAAAHLRAPRTRYQRWLRRHHFHHHYGHPMKNHGVITPLWDHVFGTYERPDVVRVPRRLQMAWLVDDGGEVKPEYRDDYVLVGRVLDDDAQRERDRLDAFANVAPAD